MAVYVDDMHLSPMGRFHGMKMCHMIAEDEGELHRMAGRIGLELRRFQGDHCDVPAAKRTLAVAYGALEITMRELAALAFLRRIGQPMGEPRAQREAFRSCRSDQLLPGHQKT